MCRMSTKHRPRRGSQSAQPDLVAEFGGRLLAAADPLAAESIAAAVLTVPYRDDIGSGLGEVFLSALIEVAGEDPSPESAALLRALAALAPARERRLAVAALGEVTAAGHYPPEWAAQIGRAAPGEAWRYYDVFGDSETIVVTFRYGESEHAILVQVDRCREPTVLAAALADDIPTLRSNFDASDDPLLRTEPLDLADARARLEPALTRDHPEQYAELTESALAGLAIARARLRRLPAGGRPAPAAYDAADRAAAVAEFLATPQAADAGDEKVARFWAEVLTGYSAYLPGDPPARVGPLKLSQMLLAYVPNTFALTEDQRHGLPGAVAAWVRWAAPRQGLDEAAVADLEQRLPEVLATFDDAYQDPASTGIRAYLADLSATTTDAAALTEALNRRALVVPLPGERHGDLRRLDAADPAARQTMIEQEYGECEPPEGMSRADFLAAAVGVCEQLWYDDPPERWREAQRLSAAGTSDHDIVHRLVAQSR
jgi:hypothetical protein